MIAPIRGRKRYNIDCYRALAIKAKIDRKWVG